jgi:hypothetical protein
MKPNSPFLPSSRRLGALALVLCTLAAGAAEKAAPRANPTAAASRGPIRIMAALSSGLTDETGVRWLPTEGFPDGDTMDRPELTIAGTEIPSVYKSERYGMSGFVRQVPNGDYTVRLHFAVTYEAIDGPGQCVFGFEVEGNRFKDFDLFVAAGGARKAYVESVPVTVSDGRLDIRFTSQSGNPTISAIEILPRP